MSILGRRVSPGGRRRLDIGRVDVLFDPTASASRGGLHLAAIEQHDRERNGRKGPARAVHKKDGEERQKKNGHENSTAASRLPANVTRVARCFSTAAVAPVRVT